MRNEPKCLLVALAVALSGPACAESTSDVLTRIEAETLLLKAREKQLEVQSNILTRQNEIALKRGVDNAIARVAPSDEPVVLGVEGLGKTIYATLQLGDGSIMEVQAGSVLPGGLRVVSIGADGVMVRNKDGRNTRLATASSTPAVAPMGAIFPVGASRPPIPPGVPGRIAR